MDVYKAVKKRIEAGKLDDIGKQGFRWVNVHNPSEAELETLSKILKLRKRDILGYIEKNQRPKTVSFATHSMILIKTINISKWSIVPIAIFLSDRFVITVSHEKTDVVQKILQSPHDILSENFSPAKLTKRIIEESTDLYFTALDRFEDELDAIEKIIFNEKEENSVKKIFHSKKGLIFIHKALTANREVLSNIEKLYVPQIPKKDAQNFRSIYHDITQMIDMEETYRDIITGVLDTHMSNVSNRMNKVVKKLTAGGALILVPTFITGLYGMNFRILPEIEWQYGYAFSWGVIILSVIVLYIYFKVNDYF